MIKGRKTREELIAFIKENKKGFIPRAHDRIQSSKEQETSHPVLQNESPSAVSRRKMKLKIPEIAPEHLQHRRRQTINPQVTMITEAKHI